MAHAQAKSIWDPQIVKRAIWDSLRKLHPRTMAKNPVMFVVEVGSVLTTVRLVLDAVAGRPGLGFELQITFWLWLTVLFANFAEAMAEGRGKAQADTLRKARTETVANRIGAGGRTEVVPAASLRKNDVVMVKAGEFIPADGEIIEGVASVDESAITGESAPVIRESGGDRSAVTGGTRVLSDWIKVRVTSDPGHTFLDRMIALVEGAERQKTPNEIALNILLAGLTIIFLLAVVTLQPFAIYSGAPQSVFVLVSLLVCLIPTTIGGLLSAIGIAGMDRLVQRNVLAMSGRAVEAAGDVHTLLLDKTGTITFGNRQATEFVALPGVTRAGAGRRRAAVVAGGRNARGPLDRRAGEGEVRHPRTRAGGQGRGVRAVHRADADVGRRSRRPADPQGRGRLDREVRRRQRRRRLAGAAADRRPDRAVGRHAARRRRADAGARRHPPEGHRQGRHSREVRRPARDGHQDGDDHRRQPADRGVDRRGSRRRRLPGAGDAGRQDGADQEGAAARASSWR